MADACAVTVRFDTTGLDAALDRLGALPAEVSERFSETVHRFACAVEAGRELLFVQREGVVAAGAGDAVVFLDPSQGLLDLLATLGAGDA